MAHRTARGRRDKRWDGLPHRLHAVGVAHFRGHVSIHRKHGVDVDVQLEEIDSRLESATQARDAGDHERALTACSNGIDDAGDLRSAAAEQGPAQLDEIDALRLEAESLQEEIESTRDTAQRVQETLEAVSANVDAVADTIDDPLTTLDRLLTCAVL